MKVGNAPQVQASRQFMAEKMLGVLERGERIFLPARVVYRDPNMCVAHIGRHLGRHNGDGAHSRIVHFETDQFGKLFPDGFGYTSRAMFIHGGQLLQPFRIRADKHRPQQARSLLLHRLQNLQGEVAAGRNCSRRDDRAVVQVLIVDFGHRNVEFVAKPVLQALYHMALLFQRMRVLDPQLQCQYADRGHTAGSHNFVRNPLHHERFDDVALVHVVEIVDRDAAFHAGSNFADIVFETA